MKTRNRQWHILSVAALVLFATIGCGGLAQPAAKVGELRTKSQSVQLGDFQSVEAEINMAAGELTVSGGADDLLQADFTYNVDELEPEVEYSGGRLVVRTPEAGVRIGSLSDLKDYRYEWDLAFNDNVPMEMKVQVAAGRADLQLGSLSLTRLDIETGASEVNVDLSNSASLTRLSVDSGVGKTTLDLSGTWQDDLDATIRSGVGELTLRLPRSVCVRAEVEAGLSDVTTQGLTKDGNEYVNAACGQSDVTLHIGIEGGVGAIHLDVEP